MSAVVADKPQGGRKHKAKKALISVGAAFALLGSGAAGGLAVGKKVAASYSDPNQPALVLRNGQRGEPLLAGENGAQLTNAGLYKSSYYQIADPFTSNLLDGQSIVQMSLAISTLYDEKVINNVKDNEVGIRMAVVQDLSAEDAVDLQSEGGKVRLRSRLKNAINRALLQKTGYAGVDNVYLTNFITQ